MDEYVLKNRLAESLRACIFKIPRHHREYEMTLQPMIQVSTSNNTKISIKFTIKYKSNSYRCRMRVEQDGAYVHVSGIGAYLDNLFIKGRPESVCSEFVKWMNLARNGLTDGDYAYVFYYEKPVGFMVKPAGKKYSYAFFGKEIEACGLKPKKILELYSPASYTGVHITCKKMEDTYIPMQAFGKGTDSVGKLDLNTKCSLLWSMLCNYSLNSKT